MKKRRKSRTSRNKTSGTPLNRGLFTAFISKACADETEWRPDHCPFEAPGELGPLIREALEKHQQKAPGEDEIKTEMLKVDAELSTEIITEFWNPLLEILRRTGLLWIKGWLRGPHSAYCIVLYSA